MANNIAEIRRSQKIEQSDLAKALHVGRISISILENTDDKISNIKIYKVAEALNTTKNRILDFSDRKRTKPDFNPHMEAFWTQGIQAKEHLDERNRVILVDKLLCGYNDGVAGCAVPITELSYLNLFDLYCLADYMNDPHTTEDITEMVLLFAAGLAGAEFFVCAAMLDKRTDIIQSFLNGLMNVREPRGGKDECNNIKTIREQTGFSQSKAAQKSKLSRETFERIENGGRCSDLHMDGAKKIAKALRCDFTDLFSPEPKDLYNIQAKRFGVKLRTQYNTKELQSVLGRDMGNVALCVRDIVGFLNQKCAEKTGQTEDVQYSML